MTNNANDLWAARDADGSLWIFPGEPTWDTRCSGWYEKSNAYRIFRRLLPNLKPGEKRRLVMVATEQETRP